MNLGGRFETDSRNLDSSRTGFGLFLLLILLLSERVGSVVEYDIETETEMRVEPNTVEAMKLWKLLGFVSKIETFVSKLRF